MNQTESMQPDPVTNEVDAVDADEAPQAPAVENKEVAPKPNAAPQKAIELTAKGILNPTDHIEAWRSAEVLLKSNAIPKQFTNVAQVFVATQFLREHNLPVMAGIRQCAIINGTLSLWGDLPKACVDRSGLLEDFKEIFFDKEYKEINLENKNLEVEPWGAACTVKRKAREPLTRSFTMDEARGAGLLTKNNSVWKFYPRRMLQMRARSLALKDAFPDVLSGVAINEYDNHGQVDPDGEHKPSAAEELNAEYLNKESN